MYRPIRILHLVSISSGVRCRCALLCCFIRSLLPRSLVIDVPRLFLQRSDRCSRFDLCRVGWSDSSPDRAFPFLPPLPLPCLIHHLQQVGNAAEHVTAVTVAGHDKIDLSIGVAVGTSSFPLSPSTTPLTFFYVQDRLYRSPSSSFLSWLSCECYLVPLFVPSPLSSFYPLT
jgi:hypothetical protein